VNAAFGIATMLIGVPTGVKIYDWIWTMFRGEVRFTPSMLLSIAFMMTFVLGGFTGIILATPPLDYMMHNTLFLVAHFHNMLIPGTLYGMIAGYMYWFPKAFGFRLNERLGRISVACWVVGFYLAFMPLYVLGAAGMARRTQEVFDPAFRPWLLAALCGAFVLFAALATLFLQLYVSIRDRDANRVTVGDPWDARGLEWSVAAPPPEWNFATIPHVGSRDPFYWRKRNGGAYKPADHYRDIELPKESACGVIIGLAAAAGSFGLVWRIWWMAGLFTAVIVLTVIARSFMRDVTRIVPAATVEAVDRRWLAQAQMAAPVPRELEQSERNQGLAQWTA
jgi:cytochrome o ubiquinol oxidase subunit 1